ncbi:unnamed protein product [marine sediment metagenome]|uniref:Uncharacterized protein n=1 Tax=marine sediment metagenome TaxID=412755 RepID=X1AEM8_9ZZZZ
METIRSKLKKVVKNPLILEDAGNTVIIVEVLEYILDRIEEASDQ